MGIKDLYESFEHRNNKAHFASILNIALSDGEINEREDAALTRFATKLDISEEEYAHIIKDPRVYSIQPSSLREERLRNIYNLFKIIYTDHYIDAEEELIIRKYAIGLGCTSDNARMVIKKSIEIFGGGLGFEDYQHLLDR